MWFALGAGPGQDNAQALAAAGLIAQSAGLIDDELAAMSANQRSADGSDSGVLPAYLRLVTLTTARSCMRPTNMVSSHAQLVFGEHTASPLSLASPSSNSAS